MQFAADVKPPVQNPSTLLLVCVCVVSRRTYSSQARQRGRAALESEWNSYLLWPGVAVARCTSCEHEEAVRIGDLRSNSASPHISGRRHSKEAILCFMCDVTALYHRQLR